MRVLSVLLIFIFASACASKSKVRAPSSFPEENSCGLSIQAFFNPAIRDELSAMSEKGLIEKGLVQEGELLAIENGLVYKNIILAEDQQMRHESSKIIALIRRYRPKLDPSQVEKFYRKLFHSCRL